MNLPEYAQKLIKERRSIYTNLFSGEEVPELVIHEMIESARWAPTHKMTQPWRFAVFSGEGLKQLVEYQAEEYRRRADDAGNFNSDKYEKLSTKPLECSYVIAIGMHRDEAERIPEIEEVCSVACAVQNMWLTASAHRVGCYWSTGGITFYDNVGEFFGWNSLDRLLGFLYLGMPSISKWPEGRRASMEDKVTWFN